MTRRNSAGINRRIFLQSLAGVGAALLAGRAPRPGAAGQESPSAAAQPDRVGVQLYTLRDLMENDFEGTIEQVAVLGYKEVEFAGYFGRTPEQVRTLLDRLGLSAPSVHVGMDLLRNDLPREIATAQAIGHEYLTVPVLMEAFQGTMTPELWKQSAGAFNEIGEALQKAGLQFAYHNHHFEFVPAGGGKTGFDVLVSETDPSLVSFELDLMWATVAGQDPVALFDRYPGRFAMWHVKDVAGIAEAQSAAATPGMEGVRAVMERIRAVGEGDIDFARIFAQAARSGLRHFFVENDAPKDALADIQTSFRNLSQLLAGR